VSPPSPTTASTRAGAWPRNKRYPGLANSWQGAAWIVFRRERARHPVPARLGRSIVRRLERELTLPVPNGYCSLFHGCAAEPLLATYAVRLGLAERPLLERAHARLGELSAQSRQWDLHLGAAGALLAGCEMERLLPGSVPRPTAKRLAARLLAVLKETFVPGIAGWPTGMAHGLAGALLAIESAAVDGHVRLPKTFRQRSLDALAGAAAGTDKGELLWPEVAGGAGLGVQAWCQGTPGVALALLALHRLTGEPAYGELAEGGLAGTELIADKVGTDPTLCCGQTGFGHIFLEAYRLTRERKWLDLARQAVQRVSPVVHSARRHRRSLHKGTLGLAYLHQRLESPLAYPMPGLGALSAG
jgi:Lanthionine synthetase C-like protein